MAVENLAARRRKAQSEPRDRFRVEPPIFQIGARSLALQRALELLHKKRRRLAMHLHQRRALLVFAAFFRRTLDRKSTRLNSSHANISYAVFCLKKKKKQKCINVVIDNIILECTIEQKID